MRTEIGHKEISYFSFKWGNYHIRNAWTEFNKLVEENSQCKRIGHLHGSDVRYFELSSKSSNLIKWTFISLLTWSLQSLARAIVICTSVLLDVPGQPPTSKLLPAMAIWWLAMATPCKVPIGTLEDCDGFFYTDRLVTEPMLTKAKKKTSLQKWNQETMQQLTCLHLSNKELNKVR